MSTSADGLLFRIMGASLGQMQRGDRKIDELDPDEGSNEAAHAVDQ